MHDQNIGAPAPGKSLPVKPRLSRIANGIGAAGRERNGNASIEFALVAIPFFVLVLGILEVGLILIVNINLANATLSLARSIRVGSVIAPGASATSSSGTLMDLSDFKSAICSKMVIVPTSTCLNQLQIDLRTQTSLSGQSAPNPFGSSNFSNSSFCYYSGVSGNIVTLRAYYLWTVISPVLLPALVNATSVTAGGNTTNGNFFVVSSSEVFKNEPNGATANPGSGC